MRYATFSTGTEQPTWGVEIDGYLHDLGPTGYKLARSLKEAISLGVFGDDNLAWRDTPRLPVDNVTFLPAIPDPEKILCIGVNYKSHQEEVGKAAPLGPTVFTRFPDTQIGHRQSAGFPPMASEFDYEGELALVIGSPAFRVAKENAFDYVAGFACYNDFSVRDWQRFSSQWGPGKNFQRTGAFGPYLVPAADVGDVGGLHLETRVNGDVRQSASVGDLVFDIPSLIEFVTTFTSLAPGDVIVTGTPGGVGAFMEPKGLLKLGDVVEVEITGLGVLSNQVAQG